MKPPIVVFKPSRKIKAPEQMEVVFKPEPKLEIVEKPKKKKENKGKAYMESWRL